MFHHYFVAALVSLVSVEVSCNLLQQEFVDNRIRLTNQYQPWEQTEYAYQQQDYSPSFESSFASNEGLRHQSDYFSAGFSRETVDAPPPRPNPSRGGCAETPDFLNLQGSPSMVFNPGAHVNFVIGVPEDYRLEVTNAPEGWKIVTITAPEGSDAITIGQPFGSLGGLPGNGSLYPVGLDGLPSSQFPFMRPLLSGSPTVSLVPERIFAPKAGDPPETSEGLKPRYHTPSTWGYDRPMRPSGGYPVDELYLTDPNRHSGPQKSEYLRKPELQKLGLERYPSHPEGQYTVSDSPETRFPEYDQPEHHSPGMSGFPRPSGQPGMYPDSQHPDSSKILYGSQTTGLQKVPERYLEEAYPDGRRPFRPLAPGYRPEYQKPGMDYPDDQSPDNGSSFPGSHSPEREILPTHHETTDDQLVMDQDIPTGKLPLNYHEPEHSISLPHPSLIYPDGRHPDGISSPFGSQLQKPGLDKFPRSHPSRIYPEGMQPDGLRSPSVPHSQPLESQIQRGKGRFPDLNGESNMYPDGHFPNINQGSSELEMKSPLEPPETNEVGPDNLNSPRSEIGTRPQLKRPFGLDGPSDAYPGGRHPDGAVQLRPREPDSPSTPEQREFPGPKEQNESYPDGQYPEDINFPEEQTHRMRSPPGQYKQTDETYPDLSRSRSETSHFINQAPQIPSPERTIQPIEMQGTYPDGQHPANINFSGPQVPEMRRPMSQYGQPDGQYPDIWRSPSEAPDDFNYPAQTTPGIKRLQLHPTGMQGRYPDGQQPDNVNFPGLQTPDLRRPMSQYGQPDGQYPDVQRSPSEAPEFDNPAQPTPGIKRLQLHPTGRYPDGQQPDNVNFPGLQTPDLRRPMSQYGQPDGQYPDVRRSPSEAPEFDNPAQPTPGIKRLQLHPTGRYPDGQQPDNVNFPGLQTPDLRRPMSQYGQPDGQYPDVRRSPSEAPEFDNPAQPTPGIKRLQLNPTGRYPDGQQPDNVNFPGLQTPDLRRPMSQYGQPDGQYPDVQRSPSEAPEFDNPAQPTPGIKRLQLHPTGRYPDGQQPDNVNFPGLQTPDLRRPMSQYGQPDGQYPDVQRSPSEAPEFDNPAQPTPGIKRLQLHPTGRYPDGQQPDNVNFPGLQTPDLRRPMSQYGQPDGQYPDVRRSPSEAPEFDNPAQPTPGIKRLQLHPTGRYPDGQLPDNVNFPGRQTPDLRRPMSQYGQPDGQYPDVRRSPSEAPEFDNPAQPTPGIKRLQLHPTGRYPDGQLPDNVNFPGRQTPDLRRPMSQYGQPDGQYPDVRRSPSEAPEFDNPAQPTPGIKRLQLHPTGRYPDGQQPDNVNFPGRQVPEMRKPMSQYGQPDGQYPDVRRSPSSEAPEFDNPAQPTPGIKRLQLQPTGRYPDGQQPDNVNFPGRQVPEMRKPMSQYGQPDGQYPDVRRSPSEAPEFDNPAQPGIQRLQLHPTGMQGRYPDGQQLDNINFPGLQTPDLRRPMSQYGQSDGQYPDVQWSPSEAPEFDNPVQPTPGIQRLQLHPTGMQGRYPDGQQPDNINFPGLQTPEMRRPMSQYGQPDGQYPDVPRSQSRSPDFIDPALQKPFPGMSPFRPTVMPGIYPDAQAPGKIVTTEYQIPGMRRTPNSKYGQPDRQYPGIQKIQSRSPEFINPAYQPPLGMPGQYPDGQRPRSYFLGQHPNDHISPSGSLVPGLDEAGFLKPGMESYDKLRVPEVMFPDSSLIPSRFDDPVLPKPEMGTPFRPYGSLPIDKKRPYPESQMFGHSMSESQPPTTEGVLSPSGLARSPNGPYSGIHPMWESITAMHPDDGPSPVYIIDVSSGSQAPGILGKPLRASIPIRKFVGDLNPNDVGSSLRFPSQGQNQPGKQSPESGVHPRPSWQIGESPDSLNWPRGFQPGEEIPTPVISWTTERYYPEKVGGLTPSYGPVFKTTHLPIIGMKGFPQPLIGTSQGDPTSQFPNYIRYFPGQHASSPRSSPGLDKPVTDRNVLPSEVYLENQEQGIPELLSKDTLRAGYPGNINMPSQLIPPEYKLHFKTPETGIPLRPSRPLMKGSDVSLPDYVRKLLEPFTTPGKNKPSLRPSETGIYPTSTGSQVGNQDNQHPDNMAIHPVQMESGVHIPGGERPTSPRKPSDGFLNDQYNQIPGSLKYNKPGYQVMPNKIQELNRGESLTNTIDFPEGVQPAPQSQDVITNTGAYGESSPMNAPHQISPDYDSSVPGRSPSGRETEPHSQQTMDDIPSGMMDLQTPRGSPENKGNTENGLPSTYQNPPYQVGQSSDNVKSGQDDSPGERVAGPQIPSIPYNYTTGGEQYNLEDHTPRGVGSQETGIVNNQRSPSMGMMTTGSESEPHYDAPSEPSSSNPQGSSMLMGTLGGRPLSGDGYDRSHSETRLQGSPIRTMTIGSPQGGQTRTIMTGGPQSLSRGEFGGYGGQSMGADVRTKIYSSGSPHMVQTIHQNTPAAIQYRLSSPHNQQRGQSNPSIRSPSSSMGSYMYHNAPSTSFKTVYPPSRNARDGFITYSSPSIKYQQPRQTMVYQPHSSIVSMPSYTLNYDYEQTGVRSLDAE